jgi:hypothetical protein
MIMGTIFYIVILVGLLLSVVYGIYKAVQDKEHPVALVVVTTFTLLLYGFMLFIIPWPPSNSGTIEVIASHRMVEKEGRFEVTTKEGSVVNVRTLDQYSKAKNASQVQINRCYNIFGLEIFQDIKKWIKD